jgi:hypothetical protein
MLMGLDINIGTDIEGRLRDAAYFKNFNHNRSLHSLSRTFCDLMCRRDSPEGEPELDQIGRITDVDIRVLYDMNDHWDEEYVTHLLNQAEDDSQRDKILARSSAAKAKLDGNLDKVLETLNQLIERLSQHKDLASALLPTADDVLGNDFYFSDFNTDKGDGYIGNNFGRDLRNFKRYLEFARDKGATTVNFVYG